MSARELLASAGGGGKVVNTQTFTASGTWIKPADVLPTDLVIVDLWGGGGGGGHTSNANNYSGGPAAGGAHNRVTFRAFELSASEPVIVGASGVGGSAASPTTNTNGTRGGYSEFKGNRAYGGAWGSSQYTSGSSGGGIYGPGLNADENSNSDPAGGEPQSFGVTTSGNLRAANIPYSNAYWRPLPGEWGGMPYPSTAADSNFYRGIGPIHGGGCGSSYDVGSAKSKSSVWGGAGGGVWGGFVNTEMNAGGTSTFGGKGGDAPTAKNVAGGDGSPRGGGGAGGNGTGKGGDGGRGEVVITVIRGI